MASYLANVWILTSLQCLLSMFAVGVTSQFDEQIQRRQDPVLPNQATNDNVDYAADQGAWLNLHDLDLPFIEETYSTKIPSNGHIDKHTIPNSSQSERLNEQRDNMNSQLRNVLNRLKNILHNNQLNLKIGEPSKAELYDISQRQQHGQMNQMPITYGKKDYENDDMEQSSRSDVAANGAMYIELPLVNFESINHKTQRGVDRMPQGFGKRSVVRRMPQGFGKRSVVRRMPQGYGKRSDGLRRMPQGFGKRTEVLDRMPQGFGKRLEGFNKIPQGFGKRSEGLSRMPQGFGKRSDRYNNRARYFEYYNNLISRLFPFSPTSRSYFHSALDKDQQAYAKRGSVNRMPMTFGKRSIKLNGYKTDEAPGSESPGSLGHDRKHKARGKRQVTISTHGFYAVGVNHGGHEENSNRER